jgi:zinc transport system substrate-binding protein
MHPTRRQVLGGASALALGGAAGCLDGLAGEDGADDAIYTAFFTLETFADAVAGDAVPVENPIPEGELGHHYEVSSQSQLDVARSRAFVYVDLPGFQRWAVDSARNLREEHPEVGLVDAAADVDLLEASRESHDHGDETEHTDHDGDQTDAGDHDGEHTEHDDGHDDAETDAGHSHGDFDPHFWLDPVRAATSVETIRDGLLEADDGNADAYESNADAYLDRLSELHETFEAQLSDRDLDTVVVASHDSFGYLADRYGFEVHSPVGVSPNAEPGSAEIRDTIEVVDDHGVDVVLYDVFQSPNLAETVLADSGASETMAVSPVAGTRTEWADEGWGYVEQMKEINLPAFKAALNAE